MNKKTAVYPGTFDPVTNAHLDIIKRGLTLFDEIRVVLMVNPQKKPLFTAQERLEMLREVLKADSRVSVASASGLLADYMRVSGINHCLRGIRSAQDLAFESQNFHYNKQLFPPMETVFLLPSSGYEFLSSTAVRQVFSNGGALPGLVPDIVLEKLRQKFQK